MKTISNTFEQLIAGKDLSSTEMKNIIHACTNGQLTDTQLAVFLALMRMKGETAEELTAAALTLLEKAHELNLGDDLIDIVGTGGDHKNTFNVSTGASIVAAAAGAKVAKHGNRSFSSKSGSADLLMQAGVALNLSPEDLKTCLQQNNICFLFAPHFHPALQQAYAARHALGIRTFFNLIGPLLNPARVKKHVVGVFNEQWQQPLAQVLANLGSERALVVHSKDGMDEASIADITLVVEYHSKQLTRWAIDPRDFDCYHPTLKGILVNSPAESLAVIQAVLEGKKGAARDIVLLNSALALYCAQVKNNMNEAMSAAANAIDSGAAFHCFEQLRRFKAHE